MKIIKRDGRIVEYNRQKIENAIMRANNDVIESNRINKRQIDNIIKHIEELNKKRMLVEDIQDMIETELMKIKKYDLAKAYIIYRYKRALVRKSNITDESILSLIKQNNYEKENQEKNELVSIQRDLIASEVSKDLTKRVLLPEKISEAHQKGIIFFHDSEFFLQPLINSCFINYKEILENDIIINENKLNKPTDFIEACNVLSQIIFNVSLNQYGEETINIKHLGKYLKLSKEKYKFNKENLKKHLENGIKIIMYQVNSLMLIRKKSPIVNLLLSVNDEYTKLISEEIITQYINVFKQNEKNPKLIFILNSQNSGFNNKIIDLLNSKSQIYLISQKFIKENDICLNEGSFNQGIVSINLSQIGLESNYEEDIFWNLLDERLDLCFEALMCRYHALLGTLSNTSPIHWQTGIISKLNKNEKIDSLLKLNNSTLTLNYIGLNELCYIIKKESIINKEAQKFALKVLKYIRSKCDYWKKNTGINFLISGIPSKEQSKYFLNIDKEKYGIIKNITDKEYYNFSYNTEDNINAFDKIKQLMPFQNICSGKDITCLNIKNNDNVNEIINFIYENIKYTKINKIE